MSSTPRWMCLGGSISSAFGQWRISRRRVASVLRSGSCTPINPRGPQARPQRPMAVSNRVIAYKSFHFRSCRTGLIALEHIENMSPRPAPPCSPVYGGGADPGAKPGEAEGVSPSAACAGPLSQAAPDSSPACGGAKDFNDFLTRMAAAPLHEFGPAAPAAEPAALGFALALAANWAGRAGIIWAGEEGVFAEDGAPNPVGLAQLGLDPARLILVRAGKRDETLWAAEQGLSAPGAIVICALAARGKPLALKATRR